MGTTYRKTAKGLDEVQHRTHRLTPRERNMLILVDGQRSDDDLAKLIQTQAPETLRRLADAGFIEALASGPPPPPTPTSTAAPPLRPVTNITKVRQEAVRRLLDHVGPAGDALAMRIEKAPDLEALRPLLVSARGLIAHVRGEQAAADYISALSAI